MNVRFEIRKLLLVVFMVIGCHDATADKASEIGRHLSDSVNIEVISVSPAKGIVEHAPLRVRFVVKREWLAGRTLPISGRVCTPHTNHCVAIDTLNVGDARRKTLVTRAPEAGAAAAIELVFCKSAADGVCDVISSAQVERPVAARYEVLLEDFEILSTRAPVADTVMMSLAAGISGDVKLGTKMCDIVGPPTYCVGPVLEGDRRDGRHPVYNDMRVGPFDLVPEQPKKLEMAFVIANQGHPYAAKAAAAFLGIMNAFGAGIYGALGQAGGSDLKDATGRMNNLMTLDCDGLVVNTQLWISNETLTGGEGSTLDARTRERGFYSARSPIYVTPSKDGCGDSSRYRIGYRIARTSWQAPLGALPPGDTQLPVLSDEQGPRLCPHGSAISEVSCRGDHCDDLYLTCRHFGHDTPLGRRLSTPQNWSAWYSEEGSGLPYGTDPHAIPSAFITAVECRGSDCDDIRVATNAEIGPPQTCNAAIKISEETAAAVCPAGSYVGQMVCSGNYCDDIFVRCCQ